MSQPLDLADETLSPVPSPRPSQNPARSLFFSGQDNATPVPEPGQPLDPTGETGETGPAPDDAAGWDSGPGSSPDGTTEPDDPTSSSTSPAGKPNPLTKRAAKETARAAVLTAGGVAHKMLARTEGQLRAGVYVTDLEDAERIGDPLGNLAHRHSGKLGGAVSDDTADLMASMFGVAGYFAKQMNAIAAARAYDEQVAAGRVVPGQPGAFE